MAELISQKALLDDLYGRDYTKFTHRDFVALVQYQDIIKAVPIEVLQEIKDEICKMRSERNCSCSDCLDIIDRKIKEIAG